MTRAVMMPVTRNNLCLMHPAVKTIVQEDDE